MQGACAGFQGARRRKEVVLEEVRAGDETAGTNGCRNEPRFLRLGPTWSPLHTESGGTVMCNNWKNGARPRGPGLGVRSLSSHVLLQGAALGSRGGQVMPPYVPTSHTSECDFVFRNRVSVGIIWVRILR